MLLKLEWWILLKWKILKKVSNLVVKKYKKCFTWNNVSRETFFYVSVANNRYFHCISENIMIYLVRIIFKALSNQKHRTKMACFRLK